MKNKLVALLVLAMFASITDASADPYKRRKKRFKQMAYKPGQVGVHLGSAFIFKTNYEEQEYSLFGSLETDRKGFIYAVSGEYAVTHFLAVGGYYFGGISEKVTITDVTNPSNVYGFDHKYMGFGLRPVFHVPLEHPKIDPYAGLNLGMTKIKSTAFGEKNYIEGLEGSKMSFGIYAGANYFFTKNIGAFVEGGYSKLYPLLHAGVAVKF